MPGSQSPQLVWRSAPFNDLVWADWSDASAVLHRPSGKTHFLNPASVWLIRRLQREALPIEAAARELAQHQSIDFDAEYLNQVESAMFRLGQLGLLQCHRK